VGDASIPEAAYSFLHREGTLDGTGGAGGPGGNGGERWRTRIRRIKKIEEALFLLDKLIEQEPRIIGDKQPFDYYLSAFLSAARTVDWRLQREQGTTSLK
jgi:hypothetical protein